LENEFAFSHNKIISETLIYRQIYIVYFIQFILYTFVYKCIFREIYINWIIASKCANELSQAARDTLVTEDPISKHQPAWTEQLLTL